MLRDVTSNEKFFIGGDLNDHIGTSRRRFERVYRGFGYDYQNQEGKEILNFIIAYDVMVVNTFFRKRNLI
jgi:hypothetical protein